MITFFYQDPFVELTDRFRYHTWLRDSADKTKEIFYSFFNLDLTSFVFIFFLSQRLRASLIFCNILKFDFSQRTLSLIWPIKNVRASTSNCSYVYLKNSSEILDQVNISALNGCYYLFVQGANYINYFIIFEAIYSVLFVLQQAEQERQLRWYIFFRLHEWKGKII